MSLHSFKHHLLIAMPSLADTGFRQSVTYICEHGEKGAIGLVVNRPLRMHRDDLFKYLGLEAASKDDAVDQPLLYGGPMQKARGFVLHAGPSHWQSTMPIAAGIHLTGSKDILQAMANNEGPEKSMIALGYAGWDAGQLEEEIYTNRWLTVPADEQILFDTDYNQRWSVAARKLGIDIHCMSHELGHA